MFGLPGVHPITSRNATVSVPTVDFLMVVCEGTHEPPLIKEDATTNPEEAVGMYLEDFTFWKTLSM